MVLRFIGLFIGVVIGGMGTNIIINSIKGGNK